MRRGSRLALSAAALLSAVTFIALLTSLSSASEGPLGAMLERLSAAVEAIEHSVRVRITGSGRARQLTWFQPYRTDGNRLRHPADVLLGAYDSRLPWTAEGVVQLERRLDATFPLMQVYVAWGDKPDHAFPLRSLTMIWTLGSVPVVTWEPWLAVFDNSRHPFLPVRDDRDRRGLAAVARGDYDFYVDAWAVEAARFGRPFFLRFAHEMNDPYRYPWGPQNGNRPEDFIAAWKRVYEVFEKMGATNVIWVWSPHISMPWFEYYYPGDEYVDWIGIGILNYGNVANWSRWWSFHQILEKSYATLANMKKPMMVCELGTLAQGGDMVEWYKQAFYHIDHTYGGIRSIVFFNQSRDVTMSTSPLNWSVTQDLQAADVVSREMSRLTRRQPQ